MKLPRASGILLHPTSLPNEFGVGDLGDSAYKFVDFLKRAKQTYWQILPLGPTGYGDSPYQSFSSFAGNTNLISPEVLLSEKLITRRDIDERPRFPESKVDFGVVIEWKDELLKKAYERFRLVDDISIKRSFETFTGQMGWWLEDYALFRAIKKSQDQKLWLKWAKPLRMRDEDALVDARVELFEEMQAQKFFQFLFFRQWSRLKNYANGQGIKIIGDMPIFVSFDSADVWSDPSNFKLNEDLKPRVVAGVPPDYFSKTGQLWGNPIYDWDVMKEDGFKWWISRVEFALNIVDVLRIDHFRGFVAAWEVPGKDKTAENGSWVGVPGGDLFGAIRRGIGDVPLIAEDLGAMDDDVKNLRDFFGLPGMKILQYGFGGDAKNVDLPHNYVTNCVAYTGTHDNETTVGWYRAQHKKSKKSGRLKLSKAGRHSLKYLASGGKQVHWDFIRGVFASVADTAIVPLQDVLGLGNKSRMNTPATKNGNWQWRFSWEDISPSIVKRLSDLTEIYGRADA